MESLMSDHHTYKKVEIVGSSKNNMEEAIQNAIAECNKSIKNLDWFEVVETRGSIENGEIGHFQGGVRFCIRI